MVSLKIWEFFHSLIFDKIDQENMFHDVLGRKNAFLDYENKKFNKSKN